MFCLIFNLSPLSKKPQTCGISRKSSSSGWRGGQGVIAPSQPLVTILCCVWGGRVPCPGPGQGQGKGGYPVLALASPHLPHPRRDLGPETGVTPPPRKGSRTGDQGPVSRVPPPPPLPDKLKQESPPA